MVIIHEICSLILILFMTIPLHAVTVNPNLCPTNKIAPHRRVASWQPNRARTFGAFYDLFTPNNPGLPPNDAPNDLQETPQEDDPDDCGEIDDYDENDLSSSSNINCGVTPQGQRREGYRKKRILFGDFPNGLFGSNDSPTPPNRPQRPTYTTNRPMHPPNRPIYPPPNRPSYPSKRPPYWSGGLFGTNNYRPQDHQYPSDYVKPVFESDAESYVTYRPNIVGGPLNHVVGVSPVRPTYSNSEPTPIRTQNYYPTRYPTTTQYPVYQTRQPRPRSLSNNNGIFKSFVDLLFK